MMIPPSTTQVVDDAGLEFSELFKGSWIVWEEIETGFGVLRDIDNSFINTIINPAITIMAGLSFGTILTMFVVPVLYCIFYRVKLPAKA